MSGGYRNQIRPYSELKAGEFPLEGEPVWDAEGRRLGFWDFTSNQYKFIRFPKDADGTITLNHKWDGTILKIQNPDGSWGEGEDLSLGVLFDVSIHFDEENFEYIFVFKVNHPQEGVLDYYSSVKAPQGLRGWAPIVQPVVENNKTVIKLIDWVGGEGAKPSELGFLGESGVVSDFEDATVIFDSSEYMKLSVYDPTNSGKVLNAESADSVDWTGIVDKPSTFTPTPHAHPIDDISDAGTIGKGLLASTTASQAKTLLNISGDDIPSLASSKLNGLIDPALLPPVAFSSPLVTTGEIADLTEEEQDEINEGRFVITDSGYTWAYTGTGDKTDENNYVLISDTTPHWDTIDEKPSTFPPSAHTHNEATTSTSGFMSYPDKTKLDSIQEGATANQTDSYLLNRANHTGSMIIDTGTADNSAVLAANAGKYKRLDFKTGSGLRWTFGTNSLTESGGNAGTNFELNSYNDAGASIGSVFSVARSSRVLDFKVKPTVTGSDVALSTDVCTANDFRAGTGSLFVTPAIITSAAAPITLTAGNPTYINWSSGINFTLAVGGSWVLGNPTNIIQGTTRTIYITSSGNFTLSYSSYYKGNPLPAITLTPSTPFILQLYAITTTTIAVTGVSLTL